ncbi:MAG: zinc ribbon domain-containing protein [Fibrobacterota bacterium]|nr:MAG: zinc ribbon domain-containing protein [Fibrobacterota bacterium]
MPIYEFYCPDCNSIFQFFSKRVNPEMVPACPKNAEHGTLERQMSRFAMGRGGSKSEAAGGSSDQDGPEPGGGMEDPRIEGKMMELMSRMESMDENDGRAMGRMMREMSNLTGEGVDDPAMQEAIRRLECGEDPEKVEEIVSDAYGEGAMGGGGMGVPSMDGGLYDM